MTINESEDCLACIDFLWYLIILINSRIEWPRKSGIIKLPQINIPITNTLKETSDTWEGVKANMDNIYVIAIAVIAIHMITLKIQAKILRLKGNPLMSNRMMLRDAMKPVVLYVRKPWYLFGLF